MKLTLLSLTLLAAVAGHGQATYTPPQTAKQEKQLDDQWNAFVARQPTVVELERRLDSLIRVIGLMHDSMMELYRRPYLQLGQWPGGIQGDPGGLIDPGFWNPRQPQPVDSLWIDSLLPMKRILYGSSDSSVTVSLAALNDTLSLSPPVTPKKKKKK